MRIDLTELLREPGTQVAVDVCEPPLVDEDVECTEGVAGRLVLTNAGDTLLVRGSACTRVRVPCSLCNRYFDQPISLKVDEQFELRHAHSGPRARRPVAVIEEDASPIAGKLFDGPNLDLTELLRQYVLLSEPTCPAPPRADDARCTHCHRLPEEVLGAADTVHGEDFVLNPAFAQLRRMLQQRRTER